MNKKIVAIIVFISISAVLYIGLMAHLLLNDDSSTSDTPIISADPSEPIKENIETETYDKSRVFTRRGDFIEALSIIDDSLDNLGDSEIQTTDEYYMDLTIMAQFEHQMLEQDIDSMKNSIKALKDPENFLIGVLMLNFEDRLTFIQSSISLLPYYDSDFEIIEKTIVSEENHVFLDVRDRNTKMEQLHEIKFITDEVELTAYIVKNDGHFYIYEIQGDTDQILTVEKWTKIRNGEL